MMLRIAAVGASRTFWDGAFEGRSDIQRVSAAVDPTPGLSASHWRMSLYHGHTC